MLSVSLLGPAAATGRSSGPNLSICRRKSSWSHCIPFSEVVTVALKCFAALQYGQSEDYIRHDGFVLRVVSYTAINQSSASGSVGTVCERQSVSLHS